MHPILSHRKDGLLTLRKHLKFPCLTGEIRANFVRSKAETVMPPWKYIYISWITELKNLPNVKSLEAIA